MFGPLGSIELFSILVFFIGLFGLMTSKDMLKSIIFTVIMEAAVIVFWISFGFHPDIVPPIGENLVYYGANYADPLPQALMITAIIIGMAVTAVNVIMFITLCRKYKTTSWSEIREKSTEDTAQF